MTALDIVDIYIATLGLKRLKGERASPILPFFILDAMYDILTKDLTTPTTKVVGFLGQAYRNRLP